MGAEAAAGGSDLDRRFTRGGLWVFGVRLWRQALYLVQLAILATLLTPADFGLAGIAVVVAAVVDTLSRTGLHEALIQRRGAVEPFYDATWTLHLVRGVALGLLVAALAAPLGRFLDMPAAVPLIAATGLTLLLEGAVHPALVGLRRELRFDRLALIDGSEALASLVAAVALAIVYRSPWAIVGALVAGRATRLAASFLVVRRAVRPDLDWRPLLPFFAFGKWVLLSHVLILVLTQGDDLVVAKLLGAAALGAYQLAYLISNTPATEISHTLSAVAFPAYARLQDDPAALRRHYLGVFRLTLWGATFVALLVLTLAPDLGRLLGDEWQAAVLPMQVLAVYGLLRAVGATTGPMFLALGRPRTRSFVQIGQTLLLLALILPAIGAFGIAGAALAVTAYAALFNPLAVALVARLTGVRAGALLAPALAALASAALALAASEALLARWAEPAVWHSLGLRVLVCAAVYAAGAAVAQRAAGEPTFSLLTDFWRQVRGGAAR